MRRPPQRDQPGDANAVSWCQLVRLFLSPFWPVKKGHPGSDDSLSGSLASDFFRPYESSD
jgi:hypothetical protein